MADAKAIRMQSYYSELKKLIENQNYIKVPKICNKIIAEDDAAVKAWQCKVVALIHTGNFQEGINCLKKCKSPIIGQLSFEKAYCEYRLNDISAAWKTIAEDTDASSRRIKELKAQILYRLERFEECYAIYRDIIKTTSDQFDQERLTNMTAVAVNRVIEGVKEDGPQVGDDASYEQLYNKGCEYHANNHAKKALKILQKAEAVCRKILIQTEEATEEEVNDEVAIIRAQQGHCHQMLGNEKEALSIYNSILKTKPDDIALLAIVNNNIVAINKEGNLFDSRKRIKSTATPGLEHKLTSRQRSAIALNHALLAYHTNQDDQCESDVKALMKNYPSYALSAAIIRAALLGRAGKLQEASECLANHAKSFPQDALRAILSAAQILLSRESYSPTVDLLLSLEESVRYKSGIVSAIVVLCAVTGDTKRASHILKKTVEWNKSSKSSSARLSSLWRQAAQFHLRNGDPQTAAASLQELRILHPNDRNTLAQLISAYSKFDTVMAKSLSKELPDTKSLIEDVDAETLESSFGSKYAKRALDRLTGEASPASPKASNAVGSPDEMKKSKTKKKNKKRKILLPKNLVLDMTPDPDRWLPRWQRKTYKKKRDKRNKDTMKGTQGVSSDAADKFDITKSSSSAGSKPGVGHNITNPSPKVDSGYRKPPQKRKGGKKKGKY